MILQCFHLSYKELFQDVHLTISENGLYLLYGKSGCGKTTFLHILSQMITDYQGEILLDYHSLSKKENGKLVQNISIMFQNECLIYEYTLFEHLKMVSSKIGEIDEVLKRLDLDHQKDQKIASLSLGQKQRAMLALIMLKRAPIVLLDEPTSQLDRKHLEVCKQMIIELAKESIVIIASHQIEDYRDSMNGLLKIQDQAIIYSEVSRTYQFSKQKIEKQLTLKQAILLMYMHFKTRIFACFKLISCFLMIFILILFLFEITYSFENFLNDYIWRYPDLYTLYISEIEEEKLLDLDYDYLTKQKGTLEEDIYLISQDCKLKEGKMPGKKEVIVSEDLQLEGQKIKLNDLTFQVVGTIDNPLLKNSYYVNQESYELLMETAGEVMVFHDLDTLKNAQKRIEGSLLAKTSNDYLSFYESYHSIITLFLTFLYCFSGYCLISLVILLFFQLKSYLSYDVHEMVFLKWEGNHPLSIIAFYMIEIVFYSFLAFILAFGLFFMFISHFEVYFKKKFFSLHFLNIINLFAYQNYRMIFILLGVLLLIVIFIVMNVKSVFSRSMSRFIKENEGC